MAIITPSIASFLSARTRRWTGIHPDSDLVAQIPPAMLAQLRRHGWYMEFSTVLLPIPVMMALESAIHWIFPSYHRSDGAFYFFVAVALLLSRGFSWRTLGWLAVNREILYLRLHGKWRWER
jgi:hypothetical protein